MKQPMVLVACLLMNMICCNDNPVKSEKSENRSPILFSLVAFPDTIGRSDSAIVVCDAMDPDGDTLVYDWITDARLRIKGALVDDHTLYHTHENSRIFYPTRIVNVPADTPWVQCFARDVRGKSASGVILLIVRQPQRR